MKLKSIVCFCGLTMFVSAMCVGCGKKPSFKGSDADIDDGYTIVLAHIGVPQHIQIARHLRKQLEQAGWENLMIVSGNGYSQVMWGKYKTMKEADDDLKLAHEYTDAAGNKLFSMVFVMPLPGGNVGKPEFNLLKAQGAYTVLFMIYKNDPEQNFFSRKKRAADRCEILRKAGYETYYYHGPNKSYVTVGTFPQDSLVKIKNNKGVKIGIRNQAMIEILLKPEFKQLAINEWGEAVYVTAPGGTKKRIISQSYPIMIPTEPNEEIDANLTSIYWEREKTR